MRKLSSIKLRFLEKKQVGGLVQRWCKSLAIIARNIFKPLLLRLLLLLLSRLVPMRVRLLPWAMCLRRLPKGKKRVIEHRHRPWKDAKEKKSILSFLFCSMIEIEDHLLIFVGFYKFWFMGNQGWLFTGVCFFFFSNKNQRREEFCYMKYASDLMLVAGYWNFG